MSLTFDYEDASGFRVHKAFYRIEPLVNDRLQHRRGMARRAEDPVVQWGPGLGDSLLHLGSELRFGTYLQHPRGIVADGSGDAAAPGENALAADVAGQLPV